MNCPPCNQNCAQGDTCPARLLAAEEARARLAADAAATRVSGGVWAAVVTGAIGATVVLSTLTTAPWWNVR